ncbi:MAG TPA: DUF1573 domain-containing protein [Thermoanaerobaculia bacterium]|nr:DUF1573 domain-containing protein [Thermoanaerobaculia bacterium]
MVRFSRLLLTTVLVLAVSGIVIAQDAKAPRLTLVDPLKDFGQVAKGEKLDWAFTIKNTGTADLEIQKVQPACGCTVAEYDKVIKPGETGKVHATVDTAAFTGPISKTVSIMSNDLDNPSAVITIKALIKPFVDAHPAGFLRYSLLQGEVGRESVVIYSEEEEPFEVIGVNVPGEWVRADVVKLEDAQRVKVGRPGQHQYRIDVTVGGPTAPVGPLVDKLKIVTNSKHQPEYQLSLSGIIRPSYMVAPSVVNFGEVSPGEPTAVRSLILTSNDRTNPDAFTVEKVESDNPNLTVETVATGVPGRHEVVLRLKDGVPTGTFKGEVRIHTTDLAKPVTTVPVTGTIKG